MKIEIFNNRLQIKINLLIENILLIHFDLTTFLISIEILYILLSNREVRIMKIFLEGDR